MKCEVKFQELPPTISVDDLNIYRVIFLDNGFYARIDINGVPQYLSLLNGNLTVYSKQIYEMIKEIDFDNCESNKLVECILDEVVYSLGITRTKLFEKFDALFDSITEGKLKDLTSIKNLRKEIQTLYSDSSSLYYVSKKLSKYISKDIQDEIAFAYERTEILITRSSDLYNIYLTEVQNELNIIIKKLTSISFIFLPVTAIASIYAVSYSSLPSNFSTVDTLYFLTPLVFLAIMLTAYLHKIGWL
ncbi:CorA family divalent cation transporter [Acidianus brierleyi]|uniref:Magnesium transporter CorA n=1 Tax=Acidianus brierleyi TaxID=41673 RepID=A0A2U9IHR4_9CREN|nr:CorA family divalent cation transporter [Acidianus brierleyi]AWR95582.1 magnesium transporter CorA family protein [Acidianus brierleyi]